jgi:two-component system, NarL family, sensor kinase
MSSVRSDRAGMIRRPVVWFVVADVVAVVLIAVVGASIARRIATNEAIQDARDLVERDLEAVAPELSNALLEGDPAAAAALDRVVTDQVLSDQTIRVKVWDADGRIVYSDDAGLVGERYPLGDDQLEALADGRTDVELSALDKAENRDEEIYGQLLEVYSGVGTQEGTPLLFEAYMRFDRVSDKANDLAAQFTPALVGGLLALFLIQIPLAVVLSRRVATAEEGHSRMLQRAIESSERERARIASDLHDSVVQGLAGTSLSIAALAEARERAGDPSTADALRTRSGELRQWIRELRTLIVSMVPPRLHQEGLGVAIADLASTLDARGIGTAVDVEADLQLSTSTESLLFRAAQEAVRNTIEHADAEQVSITLGALGDDRVRLVVADDGTGIDSSELTAARQGGHVGLQLLADLVAQAGGTCVVDAPIGVGTTVTVEVARR